MSSITWVELKRNLNIDVEMSYRLSSEVPVSYFISLHMYTSHMPIAKVPRYLIV
jgi:hypothetical protein